ncbi:MAG: DUF4149 domain-containing protein [Gammaproteobacteria bacterium]|nr:DUF4149 domain-containing protein [Gammaproteobacteria bacterium]
MGERVLLTLWVGGLWVIGYLVTPTLFSMLGDRQLAGNIAGQLFHIISYVGLVCGAMLLLSIFKRLGLHWRIWVLLAMVLLVAIMAFILQPMMQNLKLQGLIEGSPAQAKFGMLHGVSAVLYLINALMGLILVVFGLQKYHK